MDGALDPQRRPDRVGELPSGPFRNYKKKNDNLNDVQVLFWKCSQMTTSSIVTHLQVITCTAVITITLYLERTLEGYRHSKPWSDHYLPVAIHVGLVVLWILRRT